MMLMFLWRSFYFWHSPFIFYYLQAQKCTFWFIKHSTPENFIPEPGYTSVATSVDAQPTPKAAAGVGEDSRWLASSLDKQGDGWLQTVLGDSKIECRDRAWYLLNGRVGSQDNPGWKGPKEVPSPNFCSKQGQTWGQMRFIRTLFS